MFTDIIIRMKIVCIIIVTKYYYYDQTIDNVKNSNKTDMQFGTRDSNFDKQF